MDLLGIRLTFRFCLGSAMVELENMLPRDGDAVYPKSKVQENPANGKGNVRETDRQRGSLTLQRQQAPAQCDLHSYPHYLVQLATGPSMPNGTSDL